MLQNNFSCQWNSISKLPFMGDHNTSLCSWQLVGMQYAYPFASHKTFFLHCTPMAPPLILAIKVVTHINACLILVLLVQLLLSMGYITIDNITFNSNICQHIVDYIPREVNPSMNLSWTCACYLSGLSCLSPVLTFAEDWGFCCEFSPLPVWRLTSDKSSSSSERGSCISVNKCSSAYLHLLFGANVVKRS